MFNTGTIDQKTNIYRDKILQKTMCRELNQKRLRTTALDDRVAFISHMEQW